MRSNLLMRLDFLDILRLGDIKPVRDTASARENSAGILSMRKKNGP